jgi:two-component system cell cycle sensor histidine kinase/response regulator CckA
MHHNLTTPDDPKPGLYRFLFDHARDATIVFDAKGRILLMNHDARSLPRDLVERLFARDATCALELSLFREELSSLGKSHAEIQIDGRSLSIWGQAHDGQHVVILRDVTEARRVEADLRALQRVESVGHLTASLVHDFNNLLTPIACMSACLEDDLPADSRARDMARDIFTASERAAGLARQVLRYVRREPSRVQCVNVSAAVAEFEAIIVRVAGAGVEVELKLATNAGCAMLDRERLDHVLLNLVANARDAMPAGGRLTLTTARVSLDEGDADAIAGARAGSYVALRVIDTGVGMTTEVRERIFESLFTTKDADHGTGLGLATARRFVAQSHGCITVHSDAGHGTTMSLYFPSIEPETMVSAALTRRDAPGGTETILVVDDEELVRVSMRTVLQNRGYRVLEAPGGEEALALEAAHAGPIHLVIVDVAMPKMGGIELARRLRGRRSTRMLFTSGHTERMLERQGLVPEGSALLLKAFTPSELLSRVRALLD